MAIGSVGTILYAESADAKGTAKPLCHVTYMFAVVLSMLSLLLGACTTTIIPPAAPIQPVSVFVLDHGRHSSLVLPAEDGGALRYSYGDWGYYVLDDTGIMSSLRALFLPSPAALGRQYLAAPPDRATMQAQTGLEVTATHEILVEAHAMQGLRDELASLFDQGRNTRYPGPVANAYFVHHPAPYSARHNSNQVVARWLEQLGCTIIGRPFLSNWRVMPPEDND
jgi:hypothetical protein